MKTVDVRELRNRLSQYLRLVRSGEHVLVTDCGEVVAELLPPGQVPVDLSVSPGLLTLAKRRLVTLGAPGDASLYPLLRRTRRRKWSAARLLEEERGAR